MPWLSSRNGKLWSLSASVVVLRRLSVAVFRVGIGVCRLSVVVRLRLLLLWLLTFNVVRLRLLWTRLTFVWRRLSSLMSKPLYPILRPVSRRVVIVS